MRLRPYIPAQDFDVLRTWITDPRTHAMWCANLMPYPLERRGFEQTLAAFALKYGDTPFVATADDGKVIGFFSYCLNLELNSGKLKFVVVFPIDTRINHLIDDLFGFFVDLVYLSRSLAKPWIRRGNDGL